MKMTFNATFSMPIAFELYYLDLIALLLHQSTINTVLFSNKKARKWLLQLKNRYFLTVHKRNW